MDKRILVLGGLVVLLGAILLGCVPAGQVIERQVVVTPTAVSPTEVPAPGGFYGATEQEAKTAAAAWDTADKGKPDPAWKGQKFTIAVYSAGQHGAISGPLYFFRPKFEE